jgi:hypothetical protein
MAGRFNGTIGYIIPQGTIAHPVREKGAIGDRVGYNFPNNFQENT